MARRRNASKPVIRESYTLYTPESIEAGDAAEHGWVDEEGVDMTPDEYDVEEGITAVDKAVKHLRSEGASEPPSSSSFHPGIWYASMHDPDMRTGEQEEHHFHLDGFSPEEQREVFMRVKGARRFNPRHGRRANPPLSEHMAHDSLEEIEAHLLSRIEKEPLKVLGMLKRLVRWCAMSMFTIPNRGSNDPRDRQIAQSVSDMMLHCEEAERNLRAASMIAKKLDNA